MYALVQPLDTSGTAGVAANCLGTFGGSATGAPEGKAGRRDYHHNK